MFLFQSLIGTRGAIFKNPAPSRRVPIFRPNKLPGPPHRSRYGNPGMSLHVNSRGNYDTAFTAMAQCPIGISAPTAYDDGGIQFFGGASSDPPSQGRTETWRKFLGLEIAGAVSETHVLQTLRPLRDDMGSGAEPVRPALGVAHICGPPKKQKPRNPISLHPQRRCRRHCRTAWRYENKRGRRRGDSA